MLTKLNNAQKCCRRTLTSQWFVKADKPKKRLKLNVISSLWQSKSWRWAVKMLIQSQFQAIVQTFSPQINPQMCSSNMQMEEFSLLEEELNENISRMSEESGIFCEDTPQSWNHDDISYISQQNNRGFLLCSQDRLFEEEQQHSH